MYTCVHVRCGAFWIFLLKSCSSFATVNRACRKLGEMPDQASTATEQYLPLFALIWAEVRRMFDPAFVLTARGYAFVQTYAIKVAHPELPFAMNFISLMPALSNGAAAKLFPNASSPLFCFFLNVNYSQTRKSSCANIAERIGDVLDAEVSRKVQIAFDNALLAEQDGSQPVPRANQPDRPAQGAEGARSNRAGPRPWIRTTSQGCLLSLARVHSRSFLSTVRRRLRPSAQQIQTHCGA